MLPCAHVSRPERSEGSGFFRPLAFRMTEGKTFRGTEGKTFRSTEGKSRIRFRLRFRLRIRRYGTL